MAASVGYKNLGATCYLNAALHVLRACQLDWSKAQGNLGKALHTFFTQKKKDRNSNPEKALVRELEEVFGNRNRADDSGIFLTLLFQKIAEEGDDEILSNLNLNSNVQITLICELCGETVSSLTGAPTYYLPVQCNASALERFVLSVMHRKSPKACPKCRRKSEEIMRCVSLPKYLYIRFTKLQGLDERVPSQLNLNDNGKYDLIAGCIHGEYHYKAAVRENGSWWMYNDSSVHEITKKAAVNEITEGKALALIYKRVIKKKKKEKIEPKLEATEGTNLRLENGKRDDCGAGTSNDSSGTIREEKTEDPSKAETPENPAPPVPEISHEGPEAKNCIDAMMAFLATIGNGNWDFVIHNKAESGLGVEVLKLFETWQAVRLSARAGAETFERNKKQFLQEYKNLASLYSNSVGTHLIPVVKDILNIIEAKIGTEKYNSRCGFQATDMNSPLYLVSVDPKWDQYPNYKMSSFMAIEDEANPHYVCVMIGTKRKYTIFDSLVSFVNGNYEEIPERELESHPRLVLLRKNAFIHVLKQVLPPQEQTEQTKESAQMSES